MLQKQIFWLPNWLIEHTINLVGFNIGQAAWQEKFGKKNLEQFSDQV